MTDQLRQQTKGLCYGIIYGMGNKALADQLETTEADAFIFNDRFMRTYPGIKTFINQSLASCRENGYVETLIGRRRYLPHINDLSKKGLYGIY